MKVFIVLSALLVIAAAQIQERAIPIPYSFNYLSESEDGGSSSHQESSDGSGRVTGSYTVNNLEGHTRVVEYIADEDGFRAVVKSNEPGTANQNSADVTVESTAPEGAAVFNSAASPVRTPVAPRPQAGPARRTGTRYVLVPATD